MLVSIFFLGEATLIKNTELNLDIRETTKKYLNLPFEQVIIQKTNK